MVLLPFEWKKAQMPKLLFKKCDAVTLAIVIIEVLKKELLLQIEIPHFAPFRSE